MASDADEDALYKYKIGMLVKHPSGDLGRMLGPLGFEPDNNRIAGQRRIAPNGQVLAGVYRESFWNFRYLVQGQRHFMASVSQLTTSLMPHKSLLRRIRDEGGSTSVTLALPSYMNIGSSLDFQDMARLAELKTNLDIEIFPDLNNFK